MAQENANHRIVENHGERTNLPKNMTMKTTSKTTDTVRGHLIMNGTVMVHVTAMTEAESHSVNEMRNTANQKGTKKAIGLRDVVRKTTTGVRIMPEESDGLIKVPVEDGTRKPQTRNRLVVDLDETMMETDGKLDAKMAVIMIEVLDEIIDPTKNLITIVGAINVTTGRMKTAGALNKMIRLTMRAGVVNANLAINAKVALGKERTMVLKNGMTGSARGKHIFIIFMN